MNLVQALQRQHSKAQCQRIVQWVGTDPARFRALVDVFLTGNYRLTQRAAWPLSHCVKGNPGLAAPHLSVLLRNLKKPSLSDAVKRNTIRLLQFVKIPRRHQGLAMQVATALFTNRQEAIAIRVFAMTVLANLAGQNPGLANELLSMIEEEMPYGSPAFRSRGAKTIRQLQGLK
jgi:hypothetical protein